MPGSAIAGIIVGTLIIIYVVSCLSQLSIELCNKNNAIGVFYLFLLLNFAGLILGCCIISNARKGKYNKKE